MGAEGAAAEGSGAHGDDGAGAAPADASQPTLPEGSPSHPGTADDALRRAANSFSEVAARPVSPPPLSSVLVPDTPGLSGLPGLPGQPEPPDLPGSPIQESKSQAQGHRSASASPEREVDAEVVESPLRQALSRDLIVIPEDELAPDAPKPDEDASAVQLASSTESRSCGRSVGLRPDRLRNIIRAAQTAARDSGEKSEELQPQTDADFPRADTEASDKSDAEAEKNEELARIPESNEPWFKLRLGSGAGDQGEETLSPTISAKKSLSFRRSISQNTNRGIGRRMSYASRKSITSIGLAIQNVAPHLVEINRPGAAPGLVLATTWIASACLMLGIFVYIFEYQEIRRMEGLAFEVSSNTASLMVAELLAPAVDVIRSLEATLETGMATSASDYGSLAMAIAPHFVSASQLLELQLAEPQADGGHSMLAVRATPASGGEVSGAAPGILVRSDRDDCANVPGGLGCIAEPMQVNSSDWYSFGFNEGSSMSTASPPGFWEGPSMARVDVDDVICDDFCWTPSVSLVARPEGQSRLVRASLDVNPLREVMERAQELSRGDAILCNVDGDVIASSDMSDVRLFERGGAVRPAKVWELQRLSWTAGLDEKEFADRLELAREDAAPFGVGSYQVRVSKLSGAGNVTAELGSHLRMVLAVPAGAFSQITYMTLPTIAVAGMPVFVLSMLILLAIVKLYCVKTAVKVQARVRRMSSF